VTTESPDVLFVRGDFGLVIHGFGIPCLCLQCRMLFQPGGFEVFAVVAGCSPYCSLICDDCAETVAPELLAERAIIDGVAQLVSGYSAHEDRGSVDHAGYQAYWLALGEAYDAAVLTAHNTPSREW
jgi:hypothetical protein